MSRAFKHRDSVVRLPPSKEGGRASNTSSCVTSESGLRMRVLNEPPMRDSSKFGMRGCGNAGTSSFSCCCCWAERVVPISFRERLFFFLLVGGFGNTIVMAVSKGTHPGCRQETCMAMTEVPKSRALSGIVDSMYSITRRLCCLSSMFSFAENIMACD